MGPITPPPLTPNTPNNQKNMARVGHGGKRNSKHQHEKEKVAR